LRASLVKKASPVPDLDPRVLQAQVGHQALAIAVLFIQLIEPAQL
jgi:hypothetical protein